MKYLSTLPPCLYGPSHPSDCICIYLFIHLLEKDKHTHIPCWFCFSGEHWPIIRIFVSCPIQMHSGRGKFKQLFIRRWDRGVVPGGAVCLLNNQQWVVGQPGRVPGSDRLISKLSHFWANDLLFPHGSSCCWFLLFIPFYLTLFLLPLRTCFWCTACIFFHFGLCCCRLYSR